MRQNGDTMAKYLVKVKYSAEGARGLLKVGGSQRVTAIGKLMKGLGGKVESFYFAYGEYDAYLILDAKDEESALAVSLAVNASGAVTLDLVPLITPKQVDKAARKTVEYTPPGA